MKNIYQVFILMGIAMFFSSCYYDEFPEDVVDVPEVVSYEADIMPLWVGQCADCHNGNVPPDLRPANSYNSLLNGYVVKGNSEESRLYLSLIHASGVVAMPSSNELWPASKTELVKAWIDQGAENN